MSKYYYGLVKESPSNEEYSRSHAYYSMELQFGTIIRLEKRSDNSYRSPNIDPNENPAHQDGNWNWHKCMFEWIIPEIEYKLMQLELLDGN